MLRTHRAGKSPGGCGGWGLGSRNKRGPGVPPTPGLWGQGTSPGSPAASWAQVGGAIALRSSSAPPGGPLPSASFVLPSASFLCSQGPTWPGGGFGGQGISLGAEQAPWARVGGTIALCSPPAPPGWLLPPASPDLSGLPPMPPRTHAAFRGLCGAGYQPRSSAGSPGQSGRGNHPPLISCSSRRAPPACLSWSSSLPPMPPGPMWPGWGFGGGMPSWELSRLPAQVDQVTPSSPLRLFLESPSRLLLLISSTSGAPILSGLHFSSPLSPISLGVRVPHQRPAGALVVGRR